MMPFSGVLRRQGAPSPIDRRRGEAHNSLASECRCRRFGPPVSARASGLSARREMAMDENKDRVEAEFENGSMFSSNKIMIGMILIALLAVLIGMGD